MKNQTEKAGTGTNQFFEMYTPEQFQKLFWEILKTALGSPAMDSSYSNTRQDWLLLYESSIEFVQSLEMRVN